MIRCGHCKGVHASVAQVRLCAYAETLAIAQMESEAECEHGLSLSLCEGPMHYPADAEFDCFA